MKTLSKISKTAFRIFLPVMCLLHIYLQNANAQNVGIGSTSFTPDPQSMLEVQSTTKGVLIPRMTDVQRVAVAPTAGSDYGMLVYQINTVSATNAAGYWYWDGSFWVRMGTAINWSLIGNAGTNPAVNFIGTTDNNSFAMRTNNVECARILTNGNFGIGTTLPTQRLHVEASGSVGAIARVHSTTDDPSTISFTTSFRTYRIGQNRPPDNSTVPDGFYVYDQSANATRFYITSTGNVGIGTVLPTQKLSVSTGMNVDNNNTNNGNLTNALLFGNGSGEGIASKRTATGNANGLDFYQNFINRMRIWNNGQVCIGENSAGSLVPVADLTVLNSSVTSNVDVPVFTARHSGSAGTTWRMGSVEYYTEGLNNIGFTDKLCPLNGDGSADLGGTANSKYSSHRWGTLYCTVTPNVSSDTTLKENIQPVVYGLNQLRKINPISYKLKKDFGGTDKEVASSEKLTYLGFNAQELKQILPEVVSSWGWITDNENTYKKVKTKTLGVRYSEVIPVVVNAVKDLDRQQQSMIETMNISDFGSEQKNGNEINVTFNAGFAKKFQGTPVITVTSLIPDNSLYISDITNNGFVVKSTNKNISEVSFNWIAMAKINKTSLENKEAYTEADHAKKLKEIEAFEATISSQDEVSPKIKN